MQSGARQRLSARGQGGGTPLVHRAMFLVTEERREVANVDVAEVACMAAIGGWRARVWEGEHARACLGGRGECGETSTVTGRSSMAER